MNKMKRYCRILLPVLLLTLAGCAKIQGVLASSGLLASASKSSASAPAQDINSRMMRVDKANDRQVARNALTRELMRESDQACELYLARIPAQVARWEMEMRRDDKLESTLADAIKVRALDRVTPDLILHPPGDSSQAAPELAASITAMVRKNRAQTSMILKDREEMDIHRYSLKQALQDVQGYHQLCSLELGAAEVARATVQPTSVADKQAQIEPLMQLRQILMQQGLNTRAVQQKIDAVIMER